MASLPTKLVPENNKKHAEQGSSAADISIGQDNLEVEIQPRETENEIIKKQDITICDLEKKVKRLEDEKSISSKNHEMDRKTIRELHNKIHDLENSVKRLEDEKSKSDKNHEKEKRLLNSIISDKDEKIIKLEKEKEEFAEAFQKIDESNKYLGDKTKNLEDMIRGLENCLSKLTEKQKRDKIYNYFSRKSKNGLSTRIEINMKQIAKLLIDIDSLQRRCEDLDAQTKTCKCSSAFFACLEMGYSRESVMRAFNIFYQRQAGCTAEAVMKILMEEDMVEEREEEMQGAVGGRGG